MKIPYTIVTAAELKPGMRLYSPSLVAGWTVQDARPTEIYDEDEGVQARMALKFEDDSIFTAFPPDHRFRLIGRRAKLGHEHDYVQGFTRNASTGQYDVPNGLHCSQCGIDA